MWIELLLDTLPVKINTKILNNLKKFRVQNELLQFW